jgi:3-phenylpropionate/trans-cinnamate dioxygenase ferredoxin reductase component
MTIWYGRDGVVVGALTYEADDDYDRAAELIEQGKPFPPEGG